MSQACGPHINGKTASPGKSRTDSRFLQCEGRVPFNGNELLVKGALEAGAGLLTGYPGSPVSEFFDVISRLAPYLREKGVVGQIANNEALAAARINGARQAGLRAVAVMKSVGFHVAADALAVGNLMEVNNPKSGGLVIIGDDPWNETTQINSDSRYLSEHLHMPVLYPSSFQEIKDWIEKGLILSGECDLLLSMILTTSQADGGGVISVKPNLSPPFTPSKRTVLQDENLPIDKSVLIPPHTSQREATLVDRKARFFTKVREMGLNQFFFKSESKAPIAFVSTGFAFLFLKEAMRKLGIWGKFPVLKLGVPFPLDPQDVKTLSEQAPHIIFVEEKRGFVEDHFSRILMALRQEGRIPSIPAIWGKKFPDGFSGFPEEKGLNVSEVIRVLGPALARWNSYLPGVDNGKIDAELKVIRDVESSDLRVPARTPTFCSGCPHRDSAVVAKKTKEWVKMESPSKRGDVIFQGESGCHSMLQFAPFEGLMQNYSGMGVGGGTGAGMSPFIKNPQVVFLGDSTFFHSGIVAVSDAVKNNQNITFVILENDTTAMTGHQPTPGNDRDIQGNETPSQDIESAVRALLPAGVPLKVLNPSQREDYQKDFDRIVMDPGVKVIISQKECAITFQRRLRKEKQKTVAKQGFLEKEEKINIAQEVCDYCLECAKQTACPGLMVEQTPLGKKLATSLGACVDDGACARTKACPSFEKVVIERSRPPKKTTEKAAPAAAIQAPPRLTFDHTWSVYTAGVGGMGTGVVTEILAKAAVHSDLEVSFLDKKGLAIRNGAVYSHVIFSRPGQDVVPVIPYGQADVILGLDPLETARSFDPQGFSRVGSASFSRVMLNSHRTETVLSITQKDDFTVDDLIDKIKMRTIRNGFAGADFSDMSQAKLGSPLHANVILLGAAFQRGWLPFSEGALIRAVGETGPSALKEKNLSAFRMGREWALKKEKKNPKTNYVSFFSFVEEKETRLRKRKMFPWGSREGRLYKGFMLTVERWMDIPWETKMYIAQAVYDLFRYGGSKMAENYLSALWNVYRKDRRSREWRATKAVSVELYRAMAIKDEFWVAELLTSPEKYERDRERYKIDPANGDKIRYVHFNRPKFVVMGKTIEFEIETRDWMLRIFRMFKFTRPWFSDWHKEEKTFLRWYQALIRRFDYFENDAEYDLFVSALEKPQSIRGYREIRYPSIHQVIREGNAVLSRLPSFRHKDEVPDPVSVR